MTDRMPFLVSTLKRGTQMVVVPVSFLEDQIAVYEQVSPEIQGRERNESFVSIVGMMLNSDDDIETFSRNVTSVMYYLMFRGYQTNPERKETRERTVAMGIEERPDGLATTLYDDMDEFQADVADAKSAALEGGAAPKPPTLH